jgi:hypothetical protein
VSEIRFVSNAAFCDVLCTLLRGHSAHLSIGREALKDFPNAIANQRLHAVTNRRAEHVGGSGSRLNQLLDVVGSNQQLMERDATPKT